jgi:hypothetical protein
MANLRVIVSNDQPSREERYPDTWVLYRRGQDAVGGACGARSQPQTSRAGQESRIDILLSASRVFRGGPGTTTAHATVTPWTIGRPAEEREMKRDRALSECYQPRKVLYGLPYVRDARPTTLAI